MIKSIDLNVCELKQQPDAKLPHADHVAWFDRNTFDGYEFLRTTNNTLAFNNVRTSSNSYYDMIKYAYDKHLGIHLYPQDILFMVMDFVITSVNLLPETYRSMFVNHEGKINNKVCLDDLVPTEEKKLFDLVVEKFVENINNTSERNALDIYEANFSCSTYLDTVISKAKITSLVKSYYNLIAYSLCGIPTVHFHGSDEDWLLLKTKVTAMASSFNGDVIGEYIRAKFLPTIDQLIDCRNGTVDRAFWGNIMKVSRNGFGSGSYDSYDGWIMDFFPIIKLESGKLVYHQNLRCEEMITSLSDTPVTLEMQGRKYEKNMISGCMGFFQHEDNSVEAVRGYSLTKRSVEEFINFFSIV